MIPNNCIVRSPIRLLDLSGMSLGSYTISVKDEMERGIVTKKGEME